MAHRVTTESRGGNKVYTLHDDATGASASVLPGYGFNLFDLRLPAAGQVRPVIDAAPDFAEKPAKASHNGTPILFPYPNRIAGARFTFKGKSYDLPATNGPNAIHGFAMDAPWDVEGSSTDGGEASVTGRYQLSLHSPAMRDRWPTDAVLTVRYGLAGRRLTMTVSVTNPTADDLPYGFGIHPYFRCPLTPGGDPSKTKVILPASEYWVLKDFIPTGERRPVDDRLDFRKGKPMSGLKLDDVLTGLTYGEGGRGVCRLVDEALGAEFRLGFDRNVRELVVFTPPWAPGVIAVEPYTQTTDAIHLADRGVDGGLRVLGHGKTEALTLVMETAG
jgi:aldose 1-epimerase